MNSSNFNEIFKFQVIKNFREKLRDRNLPNIAYRQVCAAGVDLIHSSYMLTITIALAFVIHSKWM